MYRESDEWAKILVSRSTLTFAGRPWASRPSNHRDEQNIRLDSDFRELWRVLLFRFSFVDDGDRGSIVFF